MTASLLPEIREHCLRRVMSRCASPAAAGKRTRAAQIESGDRHAVIGVSKHWARGKELIERQRTMEDVAVGQAEDALQIEWRETLPPDHARFEARRMGLYRLNHEVGDGFAVLFPRRAIGKLRCDVLAEQACHVRAGWREAVVEGRGNTHLADGGPAPAMADAIAIGFVHVR